jgi:hypothetical protein
MSAAVAIVDVTYERFTRSDAERWRRLMLREIAAELFTERGMRVGLHASDAPWFAATAAAMAAKLTPKGIDARALAIAFGVHVFGRRTREHLARELLEIADVRAHEPEAFVHAFARALDTKRAKVECDAAIESMVVMVAAIEREIASAPRLSGRKWRLTG